MDPSSTYSGYRGNSFLKRWNLVVLLLGFIDVLSIVVAFQCTFFINNFTAGGFFFTEKYLLKLLLGILPFWLLLLYLIKFTEIPTRRYKVLFFIYLHSALVILLILILYSYILNSHQVSSLELAEIPLIGFMFLFLVRILEYIIFKNYGPKRHIHKNIVIIGDDSSLPFIESLFSKKGSGYKIDVIFTDSVIVKEKFEKTTIILTENYLGILHDLIEVDLIDELFFLKEKANPSEVREIIASCEELGVTFRLREADQANTLTTAVRTDFSDSRFLSFINIPNNTYALAIKKTLDINLALLMIVILSPVYIITGILIKFTSKGPVISKQTTVGGMGRLINLYKFRTIIANEDQEYTNPKINNEINTLEAITIKNSQITKTGKYLIKSGLDQLPMLFNVLKGDISIIGPNHPLQNYVLQTPDK
jgi:lipopolysaccharide/colanic/teichoic acid biosynthesis glycosyltransferase